MSKSRGIIIFGAAGSGTTTLGRALARLLEFKHIDVDSFSWQDPNNQMSGRLPHAQRVPLLQKVADNSSGFIMSGSICGWGDVFIPQFDLAVFIAAPMDIRLKRIKERETKQFGKRIAEGGDMFDHYNQFLDYAAIYDTGNPPERCRKLHEQWIEILPCPVVRLDGTRSGDKLIADIINKL